MWNYPNRRPSVRTLMSSTQFPMIIRSKPFLVAVLLFAAGCAGGRQTAVVTERPEQVEEPEETVPQQQPADDVTDIPARLENVTVGRFDTGKMWTFDNPPIDYFEEAYDFNPDSAWFARARLGALRLPNCSASFVSPDGLILTNHHCARDAIAEVEEADETLLDDGFYAASLDEEREVEDLYVDQLIEIEEITDEVYDVDEDVEDVVAARRQRADQIEARMNREAKQRDSLLTVQVIELYDGGQYSAYTFRRYNDVRLVFAPHLAVGSFGGDPDNFTYPRYSLDFSFFRAYGENDEPVDSEHYFEWDEDGAAQGEAVFVVGNPGTTSRLATVSQLRFERDYSLPQAIDVLRTRIDLMEEYMQANAEERDEYDLRNALHQLTNQLKKNVGELEGLRDTTLIARRQKAELQLMQRIAEVDTLQQEYGNVINDIRLLQQTKEATAERAGAFTFFASPAIDSHVLVRAVYGYIISLMRQRGAPESQIESLREDALDVEDWPPALEKDFLAARLRELQNYLGEDDPTVLRILQGRTPQAVAETIVENTALTDSSAYAELLEEGYLSSDDPTVPLAQAMAPLYFSVQQQLSGLESREQELTAELARARFALFGTQIPPDAFFSLRIADGVVSQYPYNGTVAPSHTTYYGMFNHYHSYKGISDEWQLPEPWLPPPADFDLSTAVNLVSTNDITGGNSGSPLLDKELRVVGVVFDSNIDALQNTYIYLDERGRAISVDSRGMLHALDVIYDADRIARELRESTLFQTEAEADATAIR